MVAIKLRYLIEYIDRHGNIRRYVRVPGRAKVRIREQLGTAEFMEAYQRALASDQEKSHQARVVVRGSFRALCIAYYASSTFKQLDDSTKNWRRHHLDAIAQTRADKPVALMQPKHVRKLRDELQETPAAANTRLKALRALFCLGAGK